MNPVFSDKPGARERQLRRKYNNPLFNSAQISPLDIQQAQQQDAEEVSAFMADFRDLVKRSVDLQPNTETDVILKIKQQLDKTYEQCAGLAGEQSEIKDMLKRLLNSIMRAMWNGIGQDAQAHSKLEMEEQARDQHFALLEHPLVADLLCPDSRIAKNELVPTLLSESAESLQVAMPLFVPEQQLLLCNTARELIAKLGDQDRGNKVEQAKCRLHEMEAMLEPKNIS
jgi:hypothetical protein